MSGKLKVKGNIMLLQKLQTLMGNKQAKLWYHENDSFTYLLYYTVTDLVLKIKRKFFDT